jgi:hypothetical protein
VIRLREGTFAFLETPAGEMTAWWQFKGVKRSQP